MRSAAISFASVAVACLAAALTATQASAQNRLPIPEGAWVDVNETCGGAVGVWVYSGDRIADLSFYGPNLSMGPDAYGIEEITRVAPSTDGFTAVNDAGFEVRQGENGRIQLRVLSLAYGEISREPYRRCELDSLPPRMRDFIISSGLGRFSEPAQPAAVSTQRDRATASVATTGGWTARADGSGFPTARARQGVGAVSDVALTCHGGRVMMAVQADASIGRAPTLRIAADGRSAQVSLARDPRTGVYVALPAPPPMVMLMAGGAAEADVAIDGRSIGRLPLVGAPTAIAEALAPCWRGVDLAAGAARQTVSAEQHAEAPPSTPSPPSSDFPVTEGFYARRDTCAEAARDEYHESHIYLTREVWRDIDGDSPITEVVPLGGSRWQINTQHGSEINIRVDGPGDFTTHYMTSDGFGRSREQTMRYRHCPLNTVPAEVRPAATRPIDYTPYQGNG